MCSAGLLRRFKERAEQVRVDVIVCYTSLLESTANPGQNQPVQPPGAPPALGRAASSGPPVLQRAGSTGGSSMVRSRSSTAALSKGHSLLVEQLDDVVDAACRLLVAGAWYI